MLTCDRSYLLNLENKSRGFMSREFQYVLCHE